jgi:hypothetical protein
LGHPSSLCGSTVNKPIRATSRLQLFQLTLRLLVRAVECSRRPPMIGLYSSVQEHVTRKCFRRRINSYYGSYFYLRQPPESANGHRVSLMHLDRGRRLKPALIRTRACKNPISRYNSVEYERWLLLVIFMVQNTFCPSEKCLYKFSIMFPCRNVPGLNSKFGANRLKPQADRSTKVR